MKSPLSARAAFTLIELLTVIAIIAVLMGLLFPAVQGARVAAKKAKAKADLTMICNAVSAYQAEYGRNPIVSYGGDEAVEGWYQGPQTSGNNNSEIIKVLTGEDHRGLNRRKIAFLEAPPAKGDPPRDGMDEDGMFYDPWGIPYAIKLDTEYDNWVEYYGVGSAENLRLRVIAVSFGPNKEQQDPTKTTDKGKSVDDVVSYK